MTPTTTAPGSTGPARADGDAAVSTRHKPLWHTGLASLLPPMRRESADGLIRQLPIALALVLQLALTVRLSNTAFQDEALYTDAGHDLLAHWLHGAPVQDYGSYFSGAPAIYPVWAALLDSVGGLWLVRSFSLACMLLTTLCIRSVTSALYGRRAGLYAAYTFALTGPVLFLGGLATFDALCVLSLAATLWLGITRRGVGSALLMGLTLTLAVSSKYTGAVFVPAVLAIVLVSTGWRWMRPLLAGGVVAALLGGAYVLWGSGVRAGILFTTANRTALSPAPLTQLVGYIVTHIGPILALALLGAVLSANSPTRRFLAIGWLATAVILPASQIHLGEAVSFEKHLAYSALFLAPLAGIGVKRIGETRFRLFAVFLVLWVLAVCGLSTSKAMYEWPSVDKVIGSVTADPRPGTYLSTSARSLAYYTRAAYPQITWEEQYGLFDRGDAQIAAAVTNKTYERVIFQSGTSGNPVEDARQAVFVAALETSPDYQLIADPFPVREYSTDRWFIYQLKH